MAKREFKGIWIPKAIWLDKNLNVTEKLLYAEIDSYDNDFGCVATNKTLCEDLQITPSTASGVIKSLEKKGYLEINYKDYNTFEGRCIKVLDTPLAKSGGLLEESGGALAKSEPSNTFSNLFSKVDDKSSTSTELSSPTAANLPKSISERCKDFISCFNENKVIQGKKSKYQSSESLANSLGKRLKKYSAGQILNALSIAMKDKFHKENNFMYVTPEYILREKTLEKYLNISNEVSQDVYTPVNNKIDHSNRV